MKITLTRMIISKSFSGNNIKLVARCEHDAVASGTNNELLFLTTKALNEWDSR